jgi:hypothetical protein
MNELIEERMERLQQCTEVQCRDGNWNWDAYMMGLANGLILAEHIIFDREGEPAYKSAPEEWRKDRCPWMKEAEKPREWMKEAEKPLFPDVSTQIITEEYQDATL